MKALVVFESMWGNTATVAQAIAGGLGESMEVSVTDVASAPPDPGGEFDLIVAGGPTHAFSMSRPSTRADAHSRGASYGDEAVGLREWLDRLPTPTHRQAIATFDTRVKTKFPLPGSAAKSAARAAHRHGYDRAAHAESFSVGDIDGPLLDGELERATAWARELAAKVESAPTAG